MNRWYDASYSNTTILYGSTQEYYSEYTSFFY